ncbi:MAG: tetratricopeptide repeat protein [Proteobacteria bacterium]|nr:tetratricopeptide repeat protein [Pseudomonadota bacterium]
MEAFLQRLKERKLVQWALAYVAAAFALIQVLDVVAQRFGWPDALERGLILALALGFFVTLVVAWYHGEKGAQKVSGTELLILALLLGVGGGLLLRFARQDVATSPPAQAQAAQPSSASTAAAMPDKSVAVLPFVNESGDKDQQYFSDGLSEDLITALSQFSGLKVVARTSSFSFRQSSDEPKTIGAKLGVAHLLEGTVQRDGDQVRITATLVRAADGAVVWTQPYDRPYKDFFALQDDITQQVAGALKAKLLGNGGTAMQTDRPPSGNLDAYNAYQQGKFYAARNNEADLRTAIEHFGEAVRLDSSYAAAWTALGAAQSRLGANYLGGADLAAMNARAQAAIDTALRLDPALPQAHVAKATLMANRDFDWDGAQAEYRRAFELAPGDSAIMTFLARSMAMHGQVRSAIELVRRAAKVDPLNAVMHQVLAVMLAAQGRMDEAKAQADTAVELQPGSDTYRVMQADVAAWRGDFSAALAIAQALPQGLWRDDAMAVALQLGRDRAAADAALKTMIDRHANGASYQIAEIYGLRRDPDNMFVWLDRAFDTRDGGINFLLYDPFLLRYKDDPRFAAFAKKVGLPTTTDAQALP